MRRSTKISCLLYFADRVLTKELMRSEPEYCGLNASSYKDLALTTAQSKVENFAKQMIGELELVNDCSNIFQVSTMHEDSTDDELDLTGADFLLGWFVQVFSFVLSDFL